MAKMPAGNQKVTKKSRVDTFVLKAHGIDHFQPDQIDRIVDAVGLPLDHPRQTELLDRLEPVRITLIYAMADKPVPSEVAKRCDLIAAAAAKLRNLVAPDYPEPMPYVLETAIDHAANDAERALFVHNSELHWVLDRLSALARKAAENARNREPVTLFVPASIAKKTHFGNWQLSTLIAQLATLFQELWKDPADTPNGPFARFVTAVLRELRPLYRHPDDLPSEAREALEARQDRINNAIDAFFRDRRARGN